MTGKVRVFKFGGSSVASQAHMTSIVDHIDVDQGPLVVVLSAMGNTTNELFQQAKIKKIEDPQVLDAWVTQGELASVKTFKKVLDRAGLNCLSLDAFELPIQTNATFGAALIESINPQPIMEAFKKVQIVLVPGYQGVYQGHRMALGRGGSDLSAVALSISLGADRCDIFTDVPGVMTTDPKLVPQARRLDHIDFDAMIALAYAGATVLQPRSVILAKRYHMPMYVRPAKSFDAGTYVGKEVGMENSIISGIALSKDLTWVRVVCKASTSDQLERCIRTSHANILNITHQKDNLSIDCLVGSGGTKQFLSNLKSNSLGGDVSHQRASQVSIIGTGLSIAKDIFFKSQQVLIDHKVSIYATYCIDSQITFVVSENAGAESVRYLHDLFNLEKEPN